MEWVTLVDNGFSKSSDFSAIETNVRDGIDAVVWPTGSDEFTINPTKTGNGVKPIKDAFVAHLVSKGWVPEFKRFDAHYTFPQDTSLPFAVEWETGNISSSHRAINRLALGMLEQRISGGILVLPTRKMYRFLTDRVGNIDELREYFPTWRLWETQPNMQYLAIVSVEQDSEDSNAPLIRKGTDGRALL